MVDVVIYGQEYYDEWSFFVCWFMFINYKDIGILYLFVLGFVGFILVVFIVYMCFEFMDLGVQYMCFEGVCFIVDVL